MEEIDVRDLYKFIKEGKKKYYFIDIRNAEDYKFSYAEFSENIDSKLELTSKFADLEDKNAYIFFMCYLGNSSLIMQNFFRQKGYKNAFSVAGGYAAWKKAGLPVHQLYRDVQTIDKMDLKDLTTADDHKKVSSKDQLELLGIMSAGIFHEIANPLTIVDVGVKVCAKKFSQATDEYTVEAFDKAWQELDNQFLNISRSVERMKHILQVMSALSYNVELEKMEEIKMEDFVDELEFILKIGDKIDVNFELDKKASEQGCCVNKNQLIQVILNLVNNAKHAIEDLEDQWVKVAITILNDSLLIAVTDSGDGINDETLEKIVQPLYTTKEKGKGTGLGIPVVKKLCVANGGKLYYDRANPNTSFVFSFRCEVDK